MASSTSLVVATQLIDVMVAEVNDTRALVQDLQKRVAQSDDLQKAIDDRDDLIKSLQSEIATYEKSSDGVQRGKDARIECLEGQLAHSIEQCNRLKAIVNSSTNESMLALSMTKDSEKKVQLGEMKQLELQHEVVSLRGENADLKARLSDAQSYTRSLESAHEEMLSNVKELQAQVQTLRASGDAKVRESIKLQQQRQQQEQ